MNRESSSGPPGTQVGSVALDSQVLNLLIISLLPKWKKLQGSTVFVFVFN